DRKAHEQRVGQRRGECLQEPERSPVRDLADERRNLPVVDCVLDPVRRAGAVGHLEPDVEEEQLAVTPLLGVDSVVPVQLEACELDLHQATTAFATASAWTVSRTSWTRRIVAPRSYAVTAAARLAASGPVVASGSPSTRPSELLRE